MSCSALISVPLSGFPNLAAASKPLQLSRLYFAPQPFVGPPFRVFPSQEIVNPSQGHLLPCSYPLACRGAPLSLITAGFADSHPLTSAVAWYPPTTMSSLFADPKADFPVTLNSKVDPPFAASFTYFEALIPLASPFTTNTSCPVPMVDTLLGFLPL